MKKKPIILRPVYKNGRLAFTTGLFLPSGAQKTPFLRTGAVSYQPFLMFSAISWANLARASSEYQAM